MMGFNRTGDYTVEITENNVSDIANVERRVTADYIADSQNDVTQKFIDYALPLIQGECKIITENGLPKHICLNQLKGKNNG